jgi:hypothetical protein
MDKVPANRLVGQRSKQKNINAGRGQHTKIKQLMSRDCFTQTVELPLLNCIHFAALLSHVTTMAL